MVPVNLISLLQASKGLSKPLFESYSDIFGISAKENELRDLGLLVARFKRNAADINIYDDYFFGYKIPQISKEFDLLRFGSDSVVNIELKSENTGAKFYSQMIRNRYYLGFLNKKTYIYTYISNENKLYKIDEEQALVSTNIGELSRILAAQNRIEIDIDSLFNPSNYLVSPFNSTDEFMSGKFFLTAHQEEIKNKCLKEFGKDRTTFLSICGKAGTGKTLLTFDISKSLIAEGRKVLIIHCGQLNPGHTKLRDIYGWDVIPIKEWSTRNISDYFLTVIDEAQRIYPAQLNDIIERIKIGKGNCIFSYDKQQCLRNWEINNNISQVISEKTSSIVFELTEKIRTNKEIASFILALFDKSKVFDKIYGGNVELKFFQKYDDAKRYIEVMGERGWKIINYTPSNRHVHPYDAYAISSEDNAHGVIGQEFDKVVAVIDDFFHYDGNNLSIRNYKDAPYYNPTKMLFQIVTRTRIKLCVVVINNSEIMERCLSILSP